MLNRVLMMGRLTKDPELRYTKSNVPVVSISIAHDRDFKKENGERDTDFFDLNAWRATAEFINKYFKKGDAIIIDGKLRRRPWIDKDKKKRYSVEIEIENVYFGNKAKSNESGEEETPSGSFSDIYDDGGELPF